MTTKPPPLTLFTPEELARLAERARLDVHAGVKGEPVKKGTKRTHQEDEAASKREHARRVRGLAGLRVAARSYALERNPLGLTPVVWGTWGVHAAGDIFETHVDSEERIATAVTSVGARVLEVPGLAERLAGSTLRGVRLALAKTLPESSEPLLRALGDDDDPEVRKAARAKLGGDGDRWGGAFPIPPDGHPDEVLEAARRVLDKRAYDRKVDEAVQAFAPLSDALAVVCWERVLAPYRIGEEQHRAWLACLLERPGGGAALARLLALWNRNGHFIGRGITVAPLSEEVRARVFVDLLAALREREREERASEGELAQPHLRKHLAKVAVQLAPEAGDARALLEVILGCPIVRASEEPAPEGFDHPALTLSELLGRWPLDEGLRAELVAARRAGRPGRWKRVSQAVWDGLGPDPVLREKARAELDDDSESVRAAAVRALLGPLHDPSEDGELEAVARELYRRPALRGTVLWTVDALLADARRDLDAGALDLAGAIVLLQRTPPEEQTDALWSAVRALRDRAMSDPEHPSWRDIQLSQRLIRPGEWEPSDLAYARAILERAFTVPKAEGHLAFLIGILERKPGEESAAMLRDIDERATTDRLREVVTAGRNMSQALRDIGH